MSETNSDSSSIADHILQGLHDNIDARIELFWTAAVANRKSHGTSFSVPFSIRGVTLHMYQWDKVCTILSDDKYNIDTFSNI